MYVCVFIRVKEERERDDQQCIVIIYARKKIRSKKKKNIQEKKSPTYSTEVTERFPNILLLGLRILFLGEAEGP